jgi:hypothetical protein
MSRTSSPPKLAEESPAVQALRHSLELSEGYLKKLRSAVLRLDAERTEKLQQILDEEKRLADLASAIALLNRASPSPTNSHPPSVPVNDSDVSR